MRRAFFTLALGLLPSLGFLASQTPGVNPVKPFLLRAVKTNIDMLGGVRKTCVIVQSDGEYRLERMYQDFTSQPTYRIFLDRLSAEELSELRTILADEEFAAIDVRPGPGRGVIVRDFESLDVTVLRSPRVQQFYFENADSRKPFGKTLKPFLDWFKRTEKRKVKESKTEKPTDCVPEPLTRTSDQP